MVKSLSASEAEIRKVLDGATEFRILYASNDLPNASASEAERSAAIGADGSATGEGTSPAAGQVKWDWKVMERDKALVWAQKEGLHLVLGRCRCRCTWNLACTAHT